MYGFPALHCGYSLILPSAVKLLSQLQINLLFAIWLCDAGAGTLQTTSLLFQLPPGWAGPSGVVRGRWGGWREEKKDLLLPVASSMCESCSRFLHPTWQQCLPAKATWQFSTIYKSSLMMPHFWSASNQPSGDPSSGIWVPGPRSPPLSSGMLIIPTSSFCSLKP